MAKEPRVSGRKKWWDSLSDDEKFKRMQAISRIKWAGMDAEARKEHGKMLLDARNKLKK